MSETFEPFAFETERLRLRPLAPADLPELFRLYGDRQVMRFITGAPRSLAKTRERLACHLEDHRRHGFGLCAAVLRENGEMIGRCGLEPRTTARGVEGELAWMFRPAYWGRGLATEFAREAIRVSLEELGLPRVFATADHRNLASIAIMRKLGMALVRATERGVEYELLPGDAVATAGLDPA